MNSGAMEQPLPSIVVTPALPSRNSLSSEMRITLDSIIGPASHTKGCQGWSRESTGAPSDDDLDGYEDSEVPHARFHTHPADAENPFRLTLDLKNARFSVGAVVSALEGACRAIHGREAAPRGVAADGMDDDASSPASSPASSRRRPTRVPPPADYPPVSSTDCSDAEDESYPGHLRAADAGSYVRRHARVEPPSYSLSSTDSTLAGSEDESQPGDSETEEASDEEGAPAAHLVRRTPGYLGKGNPTWRHAMYISPLVWPAEGSDRSAARAGGDAHAPRRGQSVKHKAPWAPVWSFARTVVLGYGHVRKERRGGRK